MIALASLLNNFYGYATFFLITLASSAVPIPDVGVLTSSYASLANTVPSIIFIFLFVAVAAFLGDFLVYIISRNFSDVAKRWLRKLEWYKKNEGRVRSSLSRHEFSFIFFSRFLFPGVDQVVNYIAGIEKLNYKKFIAGAFLGELVWASIYVLVGRIFEDTWPNLANSVSYILIAATFVFLAVYMAIMIRRFFKNRRK